MLKGWKRNIKPLEVLTEGQVEAIWAGVFDVLEKTGLVIESLEALDIFEKGGCEVDKEKRRVRFPTALVEECLRHCPSSYRVEARDHENDLRIGPDRVYCQPGPGMQYVNLDTFEPKIATRKEFYDAVTVYDALPNLHLHHNNGPMFSFEGIEDARMSPVESYAARARNSSKANYMVGGFENEIFNIQIAQIVGAKGFYGVGGASPLAWSTDMMDGEIRAVRAGIPIGIGCGAVWGASAPATMAGELIANLAEDIGPVMLAQLMSSGHPVRVGTFTFPQNMKTGSPFFGNITIALSSAAFHQLWRKYKIPSNNIEAGIPNSKCMDFQTGYEKGMLALGQALAGPSSIWIHGGVHGELTAHPVMAIMDEDIAGMVKRFLEGIQVDDETLAVDLIHQVGPNPGHFLGTSHTRKWWDKEQYIPLVADQTTIQAWVMNGKKTCMDLAKEKMEEILATHKVSIPLTDSQEEDIERVLREAREYFKKKDNR